MKIKDLTWNAMTASHISGKKERLVGMASKIGAIRNAAYNMQVAFEDRRFCVEVDQEDVLIRAYSAVGPAEKRGSKLFTAMLAMPMFSVRAISMFFCSAVELRNAAPTDARYSIFTNKDTDVIYVAKVPLGERIIAEENQLLSYEARH